MTTAVMTPVLHIRLEKNEAGNPAFLETGGRRHYKIVFEVEKVPEDVYAATFQLDDSYYDPRRTLKRAPDGRFRLPVTTYGDYQIIVRLHRRSGEDLILADYVAMGLRKTIGPTPANAAEARALNDIAAN